MVYYDKSKTVKNILIQKIVCNSGLSSEMLQTLSIPELKETLNKVYPSTHPHNGGEFIFITEQPSLLLYPDKNSQKRVGHNKIING